MQEAITACKKFLTIRRNRPDLEISSGFFIGGFKMMKMCRKCEGSGSHFVPEPGRSIYHNVSRDVNIVKVLV